MKTFACCGTDFMGFANIAPTGPDGVGFGRIPRRNGIYGYSRIGASTPQTPIYGFANGVPPAGTLTPITTFPSIDLGDILRKILTPSGPGIPSVPMPPISGPINPGPFPIPQVPPSRPVMRERPIFGCKLICTEFDSMGFPVEGAPPWDKYPGGGGFDDRQYAQVRPIQGTSAFAQDTGSGWSDFWGDLAGGITGHQSGEAGVGTVIGSVVGQVTPSLLQNYVYGNRPAGTPAPATGAPAPYLTSGTAPQYGTTPTGQIYPAVQPQQQQSSLFSGNAMMPLMIGGAILLVLLMKK